MENILLVNISQGISQAGESVVVAMSAAKASTHQDVVALNLTSSIVDDNNTQVICEDVHRVVPRHSHPNLELAGQELGAIDGLRRALKVGAKAVEGTVSCYLRVLSSKQRGMSG